VQLRAYLERTRPIDKQLAYQIDKLLRATSSGDAGTGGDADAGTGTGVDGGGEDAPAVAAGGDEDALRYRPNPAALQTKAPLSGGLGGGEGGEGGEGAGGVYRPPRLNPVAMEEDLAASRQERRRAVEQKRRAKGRCGGGRALRPPRPGAGVDPR
jgi:U3 small nucleolar RNA-associated protein 3